MDNIKDLLKSIKVPKNGDSSKSHIIINPQLKGNEEKANSNPTLAAKTISAKMLSTKTEAILPPKVSTMTGKKTAVRHVNRRYVPAHSVQRTLQGRALPTAGIQASSTRNEAISVHHSAMSFQGDRGAEGDDGHKYKIVRFHQSGKKSKVIARGLTLGQAKSHTNHPETSSKTAQGLARDYTRKHGEWFDGFMKEMNTNEGYHNIERHPSKKGHHSGYGADGSHWLISKDAKGEYSATSTHGKGYFKSRMGLKAVSAHLQKIDKHGNSDPISKNYYDKPYDKHKEVNEMKTSDSQGFPQGPVDDAPQDPAKFGRSLASKSMATLKQDLSYALANKDAPGQSVIPDGPVKDQLLGAPYNKNKDLSVDDLDIINKEIGVKLDA